MTRARIICGGNNNNKPMTDHRETTHGAARLLQAWYRRHALPRDEELPICAARVWRRVYAARYPDRHVRALVDLIPRKLGRPDLAPPAEGPSAPRRALRAQLERLSVSDMACVGW